MTQNLTPVTTTQEALALLAQRKRVPGVCACGCGQTWESGYTNRRFYSRNCKSGAGYRRRRATNVPMPQ